MARPKHTPSDPPQPTAPAQGTMEVARPRRRGRLVLSVSSGIALLGILLTYFSGALDRKQREKHHEEDLAHGVRVDSPAPPPVTPSIAPATADGRGGQQATPRLIPVNREYPARLTSVASDTPVLPMPETDAVTPTGDVLLAQGEVAVSVSPTEAITATHVITAFIPSAAPPPADHSSGRTERRSSGGGGSGGGAGAYGMWIDGNTGDVYCGGPCTSKMCCRITTISSPR
jgi:hypothetical protein